MSRDTRDPVERASHSVRDLDLYDVATWEPRTTVDRLSMSIYGSLRTGARWLLILVALFILLALVSLGTVGTVFADPMVGAYVLLSAVPAGLLALYVWRSDVTTGEPLNLLVATFLLAVLFAGFAGVVNSSVSTVQSLSFDAGLLVLPLGELLFFYLVVGPVEEFVKLLAVWLYPFRSPSFDAVIDGAVYGAVAGLGFATIENALYITQTISDPAAQTSLFGISFVRSLAGPGHVIYSGIAGYYLGLAKFNREYFGPIVVKGLFVAAVIHGTYNVTVGRVPGLVAAELGIGTGLAFIGYVVVYDSVAGYYLYRKLKNYRAVYDRTDAGHDPDESELSPEVTEFDAPARADSPTPVGATPESAPEAVRDDSASGAD